MASFPDIGMRPEPLKAETTFPPGSHRHAVVFLTDAGFTHEFYPLAVDAYVRDALRYGQPRIQVLGVRTDWLDADGAIRRGIFLDPERNRLVEADWRTPFQPDSVQFLCLGRLEQATHRNLAARFRCPQVNPYPPSELADDKAATLAGWSELGLDVPRFRKLQADDWKTALCFADEFPETVLKPNKGTEGFGVAYLSRSDPEIETRLYSGLDFCRRHGGAILQERRDGVLFHDPDRGGIHTLSLRLNLVFDGLRHRLVSGFAQVGSGPEQPASCGRGGRILGLGKVLSNLVARRNPARPVAGPDRPQWIEIGRKAERAAGLFENLLLVGLDVLLNLDSHERLVPLFLEANPRPAGLSRSCLLSGLPCLRDRAGVGLELWDGLEALCRCQPFRAPIQNTMAMRGFP